MIIETTTIPEVKIIKPLVHEDSRGFFMETFSQEWFKENIEDVTFVQDNHSMSKKGILRGLHYQLNYPQGKLVRVIEGEIYDVAVDIRKDSAYFGKYFGTILSSKNKKQLWIPEGFAHGFYVLSDSAEFVYKCTNYYSSENDRSIKWNDSNLSINWPIKKNTIPILSEKDLQASPFDGAECY